VVPSRDTVFSTNRMNGSMNGWKWGLPMSAVR